MAEGLSSSSTRGLIDPTKVVRSALRNAGSVAGLRLTTEAMVAEVTKEKNTRPEGVSEYD